MFGRRNPGNRVSGAVIAGVSLMVLSAGTASAARAAAPTVAGGSTLVAQRAFAITGSLGEAYTTRTVTGIVSATGVPSHVVVTQTTTGAIVSTRTAAATLVGASPLHAGYTQWDITGHAHGDLYALHLPPVLPGGGGFFDADLQIDFAGGANGSWQIPMFDGSITGGPPRLAHPAGTRAVTLVGSLGEVFTGRTVTATVSSGNVPSHIVVTQTSTGTVVSSRAGHATPMGPSWLHSGYLQWDVTGAHTANGDLYYLHLPPVLPPAGGFFDADLEIEFAGGANGNWQIPMFDCVVVQAAP